MGLHSLHLYGAIALRFDGLRFWMYYPVKSHYDYIHSKSHLRMHNLIYTLFMACSTSHFFLIKISHRVAVSFEKSMHVYAKTYSLVI